MGLKDNIKVRRFDRYWEKRGKRDMFTRVHRYLRLHCELLEDSVYKDMYDYHRNTLIAYLRKDTKGKKYSDKQLGEVLDILADMFNKESVEYVNKYKPLVKLLYNHWKKDPNRIREIRI